MLVYYSRPALIFGPSASKAGWNDVALIGERARRGICVSVSPPLQPPPPVPAAFELLTSSVPTRPPCFPRAGVAAWIAHFVKREVETLFVHKFSRPTMPLFNLFKNSAYYWGFALAVGYPLCHPAYTAPESMNQVRRRGLWCGGWGVGVARARRPPHASHTRCLTAPSCMRVCARCCFSRRRRPCRCTWAAR
jgi:hypothetical protein